MPSSAPTFKALQRIRALLAAVLTFFIADSFDLGTAAGVLAIAAISGVMLGGRAASSLWSGKRLAGAITIGVIVFQLSVWTAELGAAALLTNPHSDFFVSRLAEHLTLFCVALTLSTVSSWLYWRFEPSAAIEAIVSGGILTWLLSGHRNYQLDAPQSLSNFAFRMGLEPQHLLLTVGAAFFALAAWYLFLSSARPILAKQMVRVEKAQSRRLTGGAVTAGILLLFTTYLLGVNLYYSNQLSRSSEGVGQKNEEGQSPLGFHSAVGKTKQPAALVRFEGDFTENPWAPMLYLREGALSEYNGKELVIANPSYDSDAPRVPPGQAVSGATDLPANRKKVVQSVYLLAKHKTLFALDYPQSVRIIRNPDPQRFLLAYQALSFAPTIKPQDLIGEEVGEPSWSKEVWEHYLRAPGSRSKKTVTANESHAEKVVPDEEGEDLRYKALAIELGADHTTPIEKAIAVAQYLSKNSIYTRSPGHQATESGDPVSPYLFSKEKRGYCVHFAHAAVYLLRLMGVPARIATGYLTDMKYAKDGHLLLQMGDRHAWPEVYVRNVGWTVFDITPAQAENEQELVPDENLLDELMQKLDPAEQFIVPPPREDQQVSAKEEILAALTSRKNIAFALLLFALTFLSLKVYIRWGWIITKEPRRRVLRAYVAFSSLSGDLGFPRSPAETRREFSRRTETSLQIDSAALTVLHEALCYGGVIPERKHIDGALERYRRSITLPAWRRVLAFLNPHSIVRFGRW